MEGANMELLVIEGSDLATMTMRSASPAEVLAAAATLPGAERYEDVADVMVAVPFLLIPLPVIEEDTE